MRASALAVWFGCICMFGCGGDDDDASDRIDAGSNGSEDANTGGDILVSPAAGITVSEGASATVEIRLARAPSGDVVIPVSIDDTGEATVQPASLTFGAADFDTPQTLTITGVEDFRNDGDGAFTLVIEPAQSGDASYDGVDAPDVLGTTTDATALLLAADRRGDLYLLDQTTGEARPYLDTFDSVTGNDLGGISAMVFDDAAGTLYAATGGNAQCGGCMYTIDLETGEATIVGQPGMFSLPGLAQRASDGAFFNASFGELYRLDAANLNKEVTVTGELSGNTAGSGLVFDNSGALLYVGGDGGENVVLYALDPDTGAETVRGTLSYANASEFEAIDPQFNTFTRVNSLTARADGLLYGIIVDEPYLFLVTIDVDEVSATLVGVTADLDGVVLVPRTEQSPALAPATPRNPAAVSGLNSVVLGWRASAVAESYNVYVSTTSGVTPATGTKIAGVTGTAHAHAVAADGTTYFYVVTAVNDAGESAPSPEVSAQAATTGATLIGFAPESGPFANAVAPGCCDISGVLDIGFTFSFFGQARTQFKITADGYLTFDTTTVGTQRNGGGIPQDNSFNDLVAATWLDLDVTQGGTIAYETRGTAPNRRLVVNWDAVAGRRPTGPLTTQVILYETTNLIEIHTTRADRSVATMTQGVENADGSAAFFVPGRVQSQFSLTNDAVRFRTAE